MKKLEMAKIEINKDIYFIYKCISAGKVFYNVYINGNNDVDYCDTFNFYKDALNYVVSYL